MAPLLKLALPVLLILGAIALSLALLLNADKTQTANPPDYQLPPAALTTDQAQPLHVDQAFKLTMSALSPGVLKARFVIEPNFYLYKDKIKILDSDGVALTPSFPKSKTKHDKNFGDSQVFDQSFSLTAALPAAAIGEILVNATYQGCEDQGICYPPVTKQFAIKVSTAQ